MTWILNSTDNEDISEYAFDENNSFENEFITISEAKENRLRLMQAIVNLNKMQI